MRPLLNENTVRVREKPFISLFFEGHLCCLIDNLDNLLLRVLQKEQKCYEYSKMYFHVNITDYKCTCLNTHLCTQTHVNTQASVRLEELGLLIVAAVVHTCIHPRQWRSDRLANELRGGTPVGAKSTKLDR